MKAQANAAVYKRMSAKMTTASNGTGAVDPLGSKPGGKYPRKSAGDAKSGASNYKRKDAPDTTMKSPANGSLKTVGSSMGNKTSKVSKLNGAD